MASGSLTVELPLCVRWEVLWIPGVRGETRSPPFQLRSQSWHLECKRLSSTLGLYLIPDSSNGTDARLSVSVLVEKGGSGTGPEELCQTTKEWWRRKWIWLRPARELERLLPKYRSSRRLTFRVTIDDHRKIPRTEVKSAQTSLTIDPVPCSEALSEDLSSLLDDDPYRDVVFRCTGQSVRAHGLILRARSPVFARMLQSRMVEGQTGEIQIEDMHPDALRLFVRYLYAGRLQDAPGFDAAMALYEAADKYEVGSLAGKFAQHLIEGLRVKNCCEVLAVADAHCDRELVERVVEFMLAERVPLSGKVWRNFCVSHPELSSEVDSRFRVTTSGCLRAFADCY